MTEVTAETPEGEEVTFEFHDGRLDGFDRQELLQYRIDLYCFVDSVNHHRLDRTTKIDLLFELGRVDASYVQLNTP